MEEGEAFLMKGTHLAEGQIQFGLNSTVYLNQVEYADILTVFVFGDSDQE